jgi:hypothetical protein
VLIEPGHCHNSDEDLADSSIVNDARAKFVKIEKMRLRHFSAVALEEGMRSLGTPSLQGGNAHVEPVEQIALFRGETRERIGGKLKRLMEVSQHNEKMKRMAKDRMEARIR